MPDDLTSDDFEYASALPEPYRGIVEKQRLRIFGDGLTDLLASRSAAEQVLLDADPKRRRGALCLIAENWKPNPSSEELYRRVTLTDLDPDVRVEALRCWSRLYIGSHDVAFSKILATMIGDESETPSFRSTAYLALCMVQLIKVPSKLEFWKSFVYDKDRLPKELDWEIVKKFL